MPEGTGIFAGTAWGCLDTAELFFSDYINKGPRLVKPMLFPHTYANTPVSLAAMEWSLTGPHENFVSGVTASGAALVEAFDVLRGGVAQAIAVGGVDVLSATRMRAYSRAVESGREPSRAIECSRMLSNALDVPPPPGEASATLLLETAASAEQRGAPVLGYILGAGLSATAEGAVRRALEQSGLTADALEVVYAYYGVRWLDTALCGETYPTVESGVKPPHSINPEALCGDVQGATTVLHVCLTLLAGHGGPCLVLTSAKNTHIAIIVRKS